MAIYYNFLTGVSPIPESVLAALRTKVAPPMGSVRFNDSDLAAYLPSPWRSPWALLDFKSALAENGTQTLLRREADFLRSIGYGVDVDASGEKMLVATSVVKELYGSSTDKAETLFQFPASSEGEDGVPTTIPTDKIAAMVEFLEKKTVPLYVARAHIQMEGIPATVRAGADLRRGVREIDHLLRDLKALLGNPPPPVGNPQ